MSDSWNNPVTVEEMYGDWDDDFVIAAVERSLSPRPGTHLIDLVGELGVGPDDTVLDIGGREGHHALLMAERFECNVVSMDLVQANLDRGAAPVAAHDHGHRVQLQLGSIEDIPAEDDSFQLVFARDMLGHVNQLEQGLTECRRVLAPGGHMVIFEVFATDRLYPEERAELCANGAGVPEGMSLSHFEAAVAAAGFSVALLDITGSEFAEAAQEAGTGSNHLLDISRMRRAKDSLIEEIGEVPYRAMHSNALYMIYRMIGKLESRIYVLT